MEFNAQITKLVKKYSGNTYTYIHKIEISLCSCRSTQDFMCDLELIRSHLVILYVHNSVISILIIHTVHFIIKFTFRTVVRSVIQVIVP